MNAARYRRQNRIREIQSETNSRLICYVAGLGVQLTRDDVVPLVDLLHVIPADTDIDLLLHTPGGEMDAAEKMSRMIRRQVGDMGKFRVVVPDYAKSAGTLITLLADSIVMSDSSELGPIDPQLPFPDGSGKLNLRPAQSYIDGYDELLAIVNSDPEATAHRQMLDKFDPSMVDLCRKVLERQKKLAEDLLRQGMFRNGGNWTLPASELAKNQKWLVHSTPIDYLESKKIGLEVTYLESTNPLWQQYWALYCEQRLALASEPAGSRLFESDYVSIPLT
jgi:hypothetical protein